MKTSPLIAALCCLSTLFISAATGSAALAQRTGTQLSPAQVQLLQSLGLRIAVPTYIPPGFEIKIVRAEILPGSAGGAPRYIIFYRDSNNSCFAIEAIGGGGRNPELESSLPVSSRFFGSSYKLNYGKSAKAANSRSYMFSDWMEKDGNFYRNACTSEGVPPASSKSACKNISPEEAVRVTESLEYFNP
ncbi:hypothetical protein [Kamptonema formosum]|uniref:hypothetical protein n=1 Tax=Kamptonema formosum TaxID=331992 RepID=UPI00034A0893|nr:hypothetical protein [Oscillatoria sp. PCC 10802]